MFNLYLPCFKSSADYCSESTFHLGFIEDILESVSHTDIVILGDTNFQVNINNSDFSLMNYLLQNFGITPCDDLFTGTQRFTYVNEALNSSSCIDHCFLSGGLHALVNNVSIMESAINCSDHRPVVVLLDYNSSQVDVATGGSNRLKPVTDKVRWDKGFVYGYYRFTGEALSSLRPDSLGLCCSPGCHSLQHQQAINSNYILNCN